MKREGAPAVFVILRNAKGGTNNLRMSSVEAPGFSPVNNILKIPGGVSPGGTFEHLGLTWVPHPSQREGWD